MPSEVVWLTQDPAIFDSEGVLLVLLHWRKPGQAKWVPLLDTTTVSTNTQQTYWPISIVGEKFHCIILKVVSPQQTTNPG
jgi:chromosome transmission fidelity protein 4